MSKEESRYDGALIIAPREYHRFYLSLRASHPEWDFSLLTLEEVDNLFSYQYDARALVALLRNGDNYELCQDELRAFASPFFENAKSSKLLSLREKRRSLIEKGLLYLFPHPGLSLLNKNILVAGYQDGLELSRIIDPLPEVSIGFEVGENQLLPAPDLVKFSDPYEELHYVFNLIANDLQSGTSPDDIYLLGAGEEYDDLIAEFSLRYGFEVAESRERRLYDQPFYKRYRELSDTGTLEESIEEVRKEFPRENNIDALEKAARRYFDVFENPQQNGALLDEIMKSTKLEPVKKEGQIQRLSSFFAPPGAHVYTLNFSMGTFPKVSDEDPFISDEDAVALGSLSSKETSSRDLASLVALLHSGKMKSLTYFENGFGSFRFPSGLVETLNIGMVEPPTLGYEYSSSEGRFLLASLLDQKEDFLIVDPRMVKLSESLPLTDYRRYDPKWEKFAVPSEALPNFFSPTSLQKYYSCPFAYYLSYLLKIDSRESTFPSRIGTIFHALLEDLYNKKGFSFDLDYDELVAREDSSMPFSNKEKYMLGLLKDEAERVVKFYRDHDSLLPSPSFSLETSFNLPIVGDGSLSMRGQYDKIVEFSGAEGPSFFIVDYKTGSKRFQEGLLPLGVDVQLPFYSYFALHSGEYSDKNLVGLFIGPILNGSLGKPRNWNLEKLANQAYRLNGIYLDSVEEISILDPDGDALVGATITSKGAFKPSISAFPRNKSKEQFQALSQKAEELTLKAEEGLKNSDFAVKPFMVQGKFNSCDNCPFLDVCYRDEKIIARYEYGTGKKLAGPEDEDDSADDDGGLSGEGESSHGESVD